MDDKEEIESAKTKANSNETKSTAESVMIKKEENIKDVDTYANRTVVGIKKGIQGMEVETQKGSGEFLGETMPYVTVGATENGETIY